MLNFTAAPAVANVTKFIATINSVGSSFVVVYCVVK